MEFMVRIIPNMPPTMSKAEIDALLALETDAAIELMRQGILQRIDRVAGRGGNFSVWRVDSPEHLDQVLGALPMAPYITCEATAITRHRVQIAYDKRFPAKA